MKIFNEKEADELIVLDIDATREGQVPNERLISQFAVECRMPLCYGGGISTVDQAKRIIGLGVEKIALGAAAIDTPELIGAAAREIGSQSVVVVIDVKKSPPAPMRSSLTMVRGGRGWTRWRLPSTARRAAPAKLSSTRSIATA